MEPLEDPTYHEQLRFQADSDGIYHKACKLLPAFKDDFPTFEAWYALSLLEQDEAIENMIDPAETTPETDDLLVLMEERSELAARLEAHILAGGSVRAPERPEKGQTG